MTDYIHVGVNIVYKLQQLLYLVFDRPNYCSAQIRNIVVPDELKYDEESNESDCANN